MKIIITLLLAALTLTASATPVMHFKAQGRDHVVERLTQGHGSIWGLEFITKDLIIFTLKEGGIKLLDLRNGAVKTLTNPPPSISYGQGGLLDIALHPKFDKNRWVYVTYARRGVSNGAGTALARARLDAGNTGFGPWEEIFIAKNLGSGGLHFGSRIAFDKDGYLYMSMGERGQGELAQKLNVHNGKVVRLFDDGRVPQDNPFVGTAGALPEIWSYGHRNPQGLFYDRQSDKLYEQEHGPQGGDEINLVEKGKNYGWPVITYGEQYGGGPIGNGETARSGMEQPLKYFRPSIAPSGLMIYRGSKVRLFTDKFVSGSLALQHLNLVSVDEPSRACEDRLLVGLNDRFRDVKQGPDGLPYVSTDDGNIYRIREVSP
jgi:glucose/arabinose dehydrogenase